MKHDFNEHLPVVKVHIVQYVTFERLKSGSIYQKLFSEFSNLLTLWNFNGSRILTYKLIKSANMTAILT